MPEAIDLSLSATVVGVLVLPFVSRRVERNLELFLLVMGSLAVTISGLWSWPLVQAALREPVGITLVVFVVGLVFHVSRPSLSRGLQALTRLLPARWVVFLVVAVLALAASVITAIIASLVLVEAIHLLKFERRQEVRITILACYGIGLGAALTPLGEPLSTIVTARLDWDFWFLAGLLGVYIVPGVLALAVAAAAPRLSLARYTLTSVRGRERFRNVVWRAVRIFVFVAALLLLGTGLSPLIDRYFVRLGAPVLFWLNMVSAVVDNATLAAAQASSLLSAEQLTAILLGLLTSGGMLIPGNIPNIIAANHLKIQSREWARLGVPLGLALMVFYFVFWLIRR